MIDLDLLTTYVLPSIIFILGIGLFAFWNFTKSVGNSAPYVGKTLMALAWYLLLSSAAWTLMLIALLVSEQSSVFASVIGTSGGILVTLTTCYIAYKIELYRITITFLVLILSIPMISLTLLLALSSMVSSFPEFAAMTGIASGVLVTIFLGLVVKKIITLNA
jgi:hypothetical protein